MNLANLVRSIASGVLLTATAHADPILDRDNSFIHRSGVNLPWTKNMNGDTDHYGWDLGRRPWFGGGHEGYSSTNNSIGKDLEFLNGKGAKLCRVFLFCDLRSGIDWETNYTDFVVDPYVYPDMDKLLATASTNNINLIPVLFDYTLGDRNPEFLTNPIMKNKILDKLIKPFIQRYGNHPNVFAWDVMNEPEYADTISTNDMRGFITDIAEIIHSNAPDALVTFGSHRAYTMADYGASVCDIIEVHDYPYSGWSLDNPATMLSNKKVLVGETAASTDLVSKCQKALTNGYIGTLAWSYNADYPFEPVSDSFSEFVNGLFYEVNSNLAITSISEAGENINLNISPTYQGNNYAVEGKRSLSRLGWDRVLTFTGSSNTTTTTFNPGTNNFFRISTKF